MDKNEIKNFIARKVSEGLSLSQIQDVLTERNVRMTFMELRLIASEIESGLWKQNEAPDTLPAEDSKSAETLPQDDPQTQDTSAEEKLPETNGVRGKTTVELSPIARPGTVASGSVKFGSGASADWFLDQSGRLGLEKAVGKPDEQDVREFQIELQKAFGG